MNNKETIDYYMRYLKPKIRRILKITPYQPANDIIYTLLWNSIPLQFSLYMTSEEYSYMIYILREYCKRKGKKYIK